jgi:hypothetical protein
MTFDAIPPTHAFRATTRNRKRDISMSRPVGGVANAVFSARMLGATFCQYCSAR